MKSFLVSIILTCCFFSFETFYCSNSILAQNISNCEEIEYIPSTIRKPPFSDYVKGLKYAIIVTQIPDTYDNNYKNGVIIVRNSIMKHFKSLGIEVIDDDSYAKSSTELVFIEIETNFRWQLNKKRVWFCQYNSLRLHFTSGCFLFNWEVNLDNSWSENNSIIPFLQQKINRNNYNPINQYNLAKRLTCWNETKIKEDFQLKGIESIEGIYENISSNQAKYKVAVKRMKDKYYLIYLSGAINKADWEEGEIKATLEKTATSHLFKANWIMSNKTEEKDNFVSFEQGLMSVIDSENQKFNYLKMYPTVSDNISSFSNNPSSGSGFALTSNGLIVTNSHVIEKANSINVRGINGDFSRTYPAKLVVSDKNNDIAILKIDVENFSGLGTIPYKIKQTISNVGENIFVLGYPLRASMGDEIKLTNGIISSRTGFQGDISSYQISAPVQPGNSGGPLFDNQGDLVGIINAKHIGAENVSYAIKVNYLTNLIDILDEPISLQKNSILSGKHLTQQVTLIKKFVYLIEVD